MLANKKILLAVSGSIAAYKTAFFVRLLKKQHAEVKVILTKDAKSFITPLTLSTLSQNPVHSTYYDTETGEWNNHVELALWADLMIIAPLTANTLGKMANGICDNLLLATYLSAKCPIMVAPAMDLDMYLHPTTQENLSKIQSYGNIVIDAKEGELASGLNGKGRMEEPEELLNHIIEFFTKKQRLKGKTILITSGPTQEAIDPVRFISNHSSGKMGTAIAEAFMDEGATVHFVTGPADYFPKEGNIIHVKSAEEMFEAAQKHHSKCDIAIFTAAVADYKPKNSATEKIKKKESELAITLVKNPDIAAELGKVKKDKIHVGFALETNHEKENALKKLNKKNFDLIVLNSLRDAGAGFQGNNNKVTFFDSNNRMQEHELKPKTAVAQDILNHLITYYL